ncbi:hypothetical protein LCGC14_1293710 [marine sediment metagenome]|uniref:Serine/threonine specific protein phosphatases domain-containing protein n=1 Tax=marine sediment metagenome TaxID=412755 RepID=A0A0F9KTD5_9ZZZZ
MNDEASLRDLINNPEKITSLNFAEISPLLRKLKKILESENLVLEFKISNPDDEIFIIGDIHGNLQALKKLKAMIIENNPKYVIFLGDLVDRGPYQLECLIYVCCLKLLEPERYFILKGNHETLEMNEAYGFSQEFRQKFKGADKFKEILSIYDVLPICATINNQILCLHGGIPTDINALKEMKNLPTTKIHMKIGISIYQIMWNDPKENLEGFKESFRGPGIFFFGNDVFNKFMEANNLIFLIRAHECFPEGFKWFFNEHLLSIFSSDNYKGPSYPNPGSYAIIKNNVVRPKKFTT